MSISVAQAQQVLQAQPFSKLLAAELLAFAADGVALRIPIRENVRQQNGFVHGGEHIGVLPHAEIIIAAPDGYLLLAAVRTGPDG